MIATILGALDLLGCTHQVLYNALSEVPEDGCELLGGDQSLAEVTTIVFSPEQAIENGELLHQRANGIEQRAWLALAHVLKH